MKDLKIWGIQDKTEIGGFTMIGPIESDQSGCTAYVCSAADAKEIVTAVNNYIKMKEALESMLTALNTCGSGINWNCDTHIEAAYQKCKSALETK